MVQVGGWHVFVVVGIFFVLFCVFCVYVCVKGQVVNISGFASHVVSVTATQLPL